MRNKAHDCPECKGFCYEDEFGRRTVHKKDCSVLKAYLVTQGASQ